MCTIKRMNSWYNLGTNTCLGIFNHNTLLYHHQKLGALKVCKSGGLAGVKQIHVYIIILLQLQLASCEFKALIFTYMHTH